MSISVVQVNPESLLALIASCTDPAFGMIEPDNTVDDPKLMELGARLRVIAVGVPSIVSWT